MEVGEGAALGILGQVCLKPSKLRRGSFAADILAGAVEGDYVPLAQVVGVVALGRIACGLTEVVEVGCGTFGFVVVVTWDGPCALLELSPGRLVALTEVLGRPAFVGVVAQGEDCALDTTDEPGCFLVAIT